MQENYIVGIYARLSRDDERAGSAVSIENQKEMVAELIDTVCPDAPIRSIRSQVAI